MILSSIQSGVYDKLGLETSPGSVIAARVLRNINLAYREIMGDGVFKLLRNRVLAVTTVANSVNCVLPQVASEIYKLVNRSNQLDLTEADLSWIREQDPGQTQLTTTPYRYAVANYQSPTAKRVSASAQMYVDSTSAGDVQTAYIEVITAQGYVRQASVTVTGVTEAAIGPADTIEVLDFYLSSAAVGEVTLLQGTGGTEVARIGIGRTRAKYTMLELFPGTSEAITLYADCKLDITELVNATDEPLVPDDYCEAIMWGAVKREAYKREKGMVDPESERMKIINRYKHEIAKKSGNASTDRNDAGFSQLGPWFPRGT